MATALLITGLVALYQLLLFFTLLDNCLYDIFISFNLIFIPSRPESSEFLRTERRFRNNTILVCCTDRKEAGMLGTPSRRCGFFSPIPASLMAG